MPVRIYDITRSTVIEKWLQGLSRDSIARQCNISTGAVSNILAGWKGSLDANLADNLRDLAISLKRSGVSASQSAVGFRVSSIMSNLGVEEEELESFLRETYRWCKIMELNPRIVTQHLKDLQSFLSHESGEESGKEHQVIKLSEIHRFITGKKEEKNNLELRIEKIQKEIQELDGIKVATDYMRNESLRLARITEEQLKWYSETKSQLKRDGIEVEDIAKFAKVVKVIYQQNYDAAKIVQTYLDIDTLKAQNKTYRQLNAALENRQRDLNTHLSFLEKEVSSHEQALKICGQLVEMGFSMKELKLLHGLINEISDANLQPGGIAATNKFFRDIQEQYDPKLGFEKRKQELSDEVRKLTQERDRQTLALTSMPFVGSSIESLFRQGIQEEQIVELARISENYPGGIIAVIQKYKERIRELGNENQSLLDQQKQQQDIREDNSSKLNNMEDVYPFLAQLSFMCYNLFKVQEFLAKLLTISFFAPHMSSLNSGGVENKGDDKNKNKSNQVGFTTSLDAFIE